MPAGPSRTRRAQDQGTLTALPVGQPADPGSETRSLRRCGTGPARPPRHAATVRPHAGATADRARGCSLAALPAAAPVAPAGPPRPAVPRPPRPTERRPPLPHADRALRRAAAPGVRARRQHGGRRGARHPRRRRARRSPLPRRTGRVRLAGRRRRHRRGTGCPRPARPLLPGQHAQDADPARPGAGLDPALVVAGNGEDENVEGSRVGLVQGGRVPGAAAVPGARSCSRATTRPTRSPARPAASRSPSRR